MSEEVFWIVWCPTGKEPPHKRHATLEAAIAHAEALASASRTPPFFVMQAVSRSLGQIVETVNMINVAPSKEVTQ